MWVWDRLSKSLSFSPSVAVRYAVCGPLVGYSHLESLWLGMWSNVATTGNVGFGLSGTDSASAGAWASCIPLIDSGSEWPIDSRPGFRVYSAAAGPHQIVIPAWRAIGAGPVWLLMATAISAGTLDLLLVVTVGRWRWLDGVKGGPGRGESVGGDGEGAEPGGAAGV
jgi:hypothetical protein